MKKLLLILITMSCTLKGMATVYSENNPVIPYSIDLSERFFGKPDANNSAWDFKSWTSIYPSDNPSSVSWNSYISQINISTVNGTMASGFAAIGRHKESANIWLVSPGLPLEAGKMYEIAYNYKRFPGIIEETKQPVYVTEKFEVGISKYKTADDLQKQILNTYEVNNNEYETGKTLITIDDSGIYYIGIHLISDATPNLIETFFCLSSFSVEEKVNIIPNPVTELTVIPDPDKKLSAHLSWTNPSLWTNGENIVGNMEVEIYRNDELIKTLSGITPGTTSTYDDIEVPKAGLYKYDIRVKIEDKLSIKVKSDQIEIGNLLIEANLPYQIDFTQSAPYGKPDDANPTCTWEKWTKINPAGSAAGVWDEQLGELNAGENKSGICAYCQHTGAADAWTVSPMVYLEKGKAYAITYSYKRFPSTSEIYKEKFEIGFGRKKTIEALKQNIFATHEVENSDYKTNVIVIQVDESGEYSIGFHCISDATGGEASNLCLGSIAVEETTAVKPQVITKAAVRSSKKEMFVANLSWTNPTQGIGNETLEGKLTAKIYRNEQIIETLTDIEPGSKTEWNDNVGEKGQFTYKVSIGWRGIYNDATLLGSCELKSFIPLKISDLAGKAEGKAITLTWTNPSVYSADGMTPSDIPLPEKMYIDIYRAGTLINTIEDQTPGSKVEFKDNVPSEQRWLYWVICRIDDEVKSNSSNLFSIDLTPIVKPATPINLKAVTDTQTELQVNLSWTNPNRGTKEEDLTGKQFTALIFKNDELVETLLYLDAGAETKWSDTVEKEGAYIYSVSLELDKVYSDTIDASCYVEYFKPASITDFTYKTENDNCILQWKAPDKYINGNELKDKMTVSLYCNEEVIATFKDQIPGASGEYKDALKDGDRKVYFLTVTLPNGANSSRSKTILVNYTSGIETQQTTSAHYDNTTGTLYVGQTTDVKVYNTSGVCVLRKAKVCESLSLKELPSAIYFVKFGNEKPETMKIIK